LILRGTFFRCRKLKGTLACQKREILLFGHSGQRVPPSCLTEKTGGSLKLSHQGGGNALQSQKGCPWFQHTLCHLAKKLQAKGGGERYGRKPRFGNIVQRKGPRSQNGYLKEFGGGGDKLPDSNWGTYCKKRTGGSNTEKPTRTVKKGKRKSQGPGAGRK